MPRVSFVNEVVTVEAKSGRTISEVAEENGIVLHRGLWTWAHCRGFGLCGSCRVWATPLADKALSPKGLLERIRPGLAGSLRLACQARVLGDCEIRTKPGGPRVEQTTEWAEDPRPSRWKDRLRAADAGAKDEPEPEAKEPAAG